MSFNNLDIHMDIQLVTEIYSPTIGPTLKKEEIGFFF